MGLVRNLIAIVVLITSFTVYTKIKAVLDYPEKPQIDDIWWGPGDPSKTDTSIKPFKINVPDNVLQDLQKRLANHIPFQPPLEGAKQNYGINTHLLNNIVNFWRNKYNWTEREKYLNQFPQFQVNIQGLNIHYIHVKPKETKGFKVLPMLILHGWPGSVREFYDIIPILTTPQKGNTFVFEVIVPSLIGYGFSDGPVRPGLSTVHMANIFKNFMDRLGFERYYVQGGDAGALTGHAMADLYPEKIIGLHSNMCVIITPLMFTKFFLGMFFPSLIGIPKEQEEYLYPLSDKLFFLMEEAGYMHIQATKPDTLGVALRDSPVGLAAYILEKFCTWTNPAWRNLEDGGLTKRYTYTDLLDNVMIYWVTRSMTTAFRLYSESLNKATLGLQLDRMPVEVPTGCVRFKNDMINLPDVLLKEKFLNLVHSADYDDGGHFAAFEKPQVFTKDLFLFVEKVQNLMSE